MRKRYPPRAGFTLIELVVICLIAAVILSLALVGYRKTILIQVERQAINQLQTIYASNEIYKTKNGAYLTGTSLDRTAINSGLNLAIPNDGISYTYSTDAGYDYTVFAEYRVNGSQAFVLRLVGSEDLLSLLEEEPFNMDLFVTNAYAGSVGPRYNPCCNSGTCYSVHGCNY